VKIQTKRIYAASSVQDGTRILIDRIWPRGVSKDQAKLDYWAKELAPSHELRQWYGHDPDLWKEFQERYFQELGDPARVLQILAPFSENDKITLLFSSREEQFNNATALKNYLRQHDFGS
jgi:uncharacterized protein YeaO (DUF488 family)